MSACDLAYSDTKQGEVATITGEALPIAGALASCASPFFSKSPAALTSRTLAGHSGRGPGAGSRLIEWLGAPPIRDARWGALYCRWRRDGYWHGRGPRFSPDVSTNRQSVREYLESDLAARSRRVRVESLARANERGSDHGRHEWWRGHGSGA